MFLGDTLSRLHIKTQEDVHNAIPLNVLPHFNTGHIYHNYEYLVHTHDKYKA